MAQFGDQVQAALQDHLQGIVVAKVSIECQITDREQVFQDFELVFDHVLDAQQLWGQLDQGFVPVLAAFGPTRFFL